MKWPFIPLFVISLLFASCGKDDNDPTPENNGIIRSVAIVTSDKHVAFPTIASDANFQRIVVAYREGTGHVSFDGRIMQTVSTDGGVGWSVPEIVYTPPSGSDTRDPQFFVINKDYGTMLCRFFVRSSDSTYTTQCMFSNTMGRHYENPEVTPFPNAKITISAARGNMTMIDDTIYSVCYGRDQETWIDRYNYTKMNWEFYTWLDKSLKDASAVGKKDTIFYRINESSLGYYHDTLYIVGRQFSSAPQWLQWGKSINKGKSWKWSLLPIKGHAPSLTPYKDSFIMTYRAFNDDKTKYSFNIALIKNSQIVGGPITLLESSDMDIGYGDVLIMPKSFLVCCYQQGKIMLYEISYNIFK
jgi:hypothetical protein